MQTLTLESVRENSNAREEFLNNLLRKNSARIYRLLVGSFTPGTQTFSDLIGGDLQQSFLLGAHRAIDKFREQDDGRGKNDYAGFCSWAGLNAVRDRIREAYREQRINANQINAGTFSQNDSQKSADTLHFEHLQRVISQATKADDTTKRADEHDMISAFLLKLSDKDRIVAESFLLGYGPAQRNNDPFEKGRRRRQNYIHEMEMVTGYSEQKLMASIKRLRKSAAEHWGMRYA